MKPRVTKPGKKLSQAIRLADPHRTALCEGKHGEGGCDFSAGPAPSQVVVKAGIVHREAHRDHRVVWVRAGVV